MYLPDNVQCTYFFLFNIYYSVDNTYWRAKPNQKSVNQENRQLPFGCLNINTASVTSPQKNSPKT